MHADKRHKQFSVRIPVELADAIDRELKKFKARHPGVKIGYGKVVRALLHEQFVRRLSVVPLDGLLTQAEDDELA